MLRLVTLRRCAVSSTAPSSPSLFSIDPSRPFAMVEREIAAVREHIQSLVANTHNTVLDHAARYALQSGGKLLRPALVALMAHALVTPAQSHRFADSPLGSLDDITAGTILPFLRLAEVTELIHTASLVHDDVIDDCPTRRGKCALHNTRLGTKRAVLAGDYLLARASFYIATLEVPRIVVLMTTALEELVTGELMQMDGCFDVARYEQKNYCKTASLVANALASAALLADAKSEEKELLAFRFGKHLGLAFQVIDDCLDLSGEAATLGKPALADMRAGVATLPVLLAGQREAAVQEAVQRRFTREGDIALCEAAIVRHDCVAEAMRYAEGHCQEASNALQGLPASSARAALEAALNSVLYRKH